mmetsp:Transcript_22714/g.73565  ORF Transcript_22714/g.73565 Transcript_22714/m.73565 type:complete len:231 (-) Transcript_22714:160-852(-)|eukprot:scaffold3777_cov123-Isochrysis_galbana.AAC.17
MDRSHALEGGAVGRVPRADQVEQLVVRTHQVHVADEEPVHVLHSCADQLRNLALHEGDWVHHALGADDVDLAGREQARRAQVEVILVPRLAEDRVPRVLSGVDAGNNLDRRVPRNRVHRLALALVAKVGASHHHHPRLVDQRVQHLLHRRLLVPRARHVVQLRQPRKVLEQRVHLGTLARQLLVVADRDLALLGPRRPARAGSRRHSRLVLPLLLVALLVLLVVDQGRLV